MFSRMQVITVQSVIGGIPSVSSVVLITILLVVLMIIGIIIFLKIMRELPSLDNLLVLIKQGENDAKNYPIEMPKRKGLTDYLLSIGTLSADHLAFSNFYVMTANLGGFFSPVKTAAFCKEAIQYAIQAGARCIIFDIWPNSSKGAKQGPILQVCANDDSIEKISYYTLDLRTAFEEVNKWAFEDSANPHSNDPMILYLRFRGKPVANTFTETATALIKVFQQRRLPYNFTSTSSNPLYSTPINTVLPGKIIILSDQPGTGTSFAEWVNNPVPPNNSPFQRKTIATPGEVRGLTSDQSSTLDNTCTQNLMACAPLPEDISNSESNGWNWKGAQKVGIQYCGLNLWVQDKGLDTYMAPNMFGTYSFMIKPNNPPPHRYTIERIPPPIPVKDLGYGTGTLTVR